MKFLSLLKNFIKSWVIILKCKGRLKNLFKKFKENKKFLFEYDKVINEQKNLNIVEKVTDYEAGATHYLAHGPVIREDKEITKTRIVLDASCKSRVEGPSLDDVLESGPLLTPLLTCLQMYY